MTRRLLFASLTALFAAMPAAGAWAQTETPSVGETPAQTETQTETPGPAPYTPPTEAPAPAPATGSAQAPEPAASEMPAAETSLGADAAAAATSLPTMIEDVQVVGPWTETGKSGVWRTIMMQVGATKESYRFFVQRIEKAGETSSVRSTTEIKEIPGVNGTIIGYRADEPSAENSGGLSLFFDIVPADGEIAETYELHFQNDTSYTFGPATN